MSKTSKSKWKRGELNNKKKAAIVREYRKVLKSMKKEKTGSHVPISSGAGSSSNLKAMRPQEKSKRLPIFKQAMLEFHEKQSEKERQREARETARKQKEEALKRHREKRKEFFKRMSKKTKWGQPIMKNQIEYFLEKIQGQMEQSS